MLVISLPRRLIIDGQMIDVVVDGRYAKGEGCDGVYIPKKRKIVIDSGLDDVTLTDTLIHEILHAVYPSVKKGTMANDGFEEDLVQHVTPRLLFVLQQLRWIEFDPRRKTRDSRHGR